MYSRVQLKKLPFVFLRTKEPEAILIISEEVFEAKVCSLSKHGRTYHLIYWKSVCLRGSGLDSPWNVGRTCRQMLRQKWILTRQQLGGLPLALNVAEQIELVSLWSWKLKGIVNLSSELRAVSSLCLEPESVTTYIHFPNSVAILSKHSGKILLEEFFELCGTHGLCQMTQLCYCGMLIYHRMDVTAPKYYLKE